MLREETRALPSGPYNKRMLHQTETYNFYYWEMIRAGTSPSFAIAAAQAYNLCQTFTGSAFLIRRDNSTTLQKLPDATPYIIPADDLSRLRDCNALQTGLQRLCEKFGKVLLVPGNHEFYGSSREEGRKSRRRWAKMSVTRSSSRTGRELTLKTW